MTDTEPVLPWRIRAPRIVTDFLSPAVKRVAAALGVDPTTIMGTGTDGRVTREDVSLGPAPVRGDEIAPFNNVRKRAAGLLVASKQTSAHTLIVARTDYSAIEEVRAQARMTYLPFVARAVCDALRAYPLVNSSVDGDGLVVHKAINLGVAVDLDYQGLVVPVVHGADGLRLHALAAAIRDVASRARAKKLTVDDLTGGTFTITNPGASGTWISFPIINQPNVGIVSTDGVSKQVIVDDRGRLVIAPIGHLCLTFDHRAMDGAYAAAFLAHLQEIVETRDWSTEL